MRVLDLFSGAGLAAIGYHLAGAEVIGVDIKRQPRFPFAFIQADALSLDLRFLRYFDLIHASPPCQRFTAMRSAKGAKGDKHPDLITPTRKLLQAAGVPYIIENVEGAPLLDPMMLCGSMFDLGARAGGTFYQLQRHRLFETNWPLLAPGVCAHTSPVIGVYGGHVRCRAAKHGGRLTRDFVGYDKPALAHRAMGLDARWSPTMTDMSEAIPPAYTRWAAEQFKAWKIKRIAA